MDIRRFFTYLIPYIIKGIPVTISVSALALMMGAVIGIFLSMLRVYGRKSIQIILTVYGTVFRSIPQTVLLLLLFFSIAGSINIEPYWAAVFSLTIISSSYQTEIFRGAFLSIDSGQMMAARAIGMSRGKAIQVIMLPQVFRRALPAWTNEVAVTIKASALVYILGIPEMLRLAQYDISRTKQPFPAYLAVGLLYFLLIYTTNRILRMVEQKLRIEGMQ
ncbi:MAG: amino acid ABC transporter permease [Treponema sp.]|nr:amino acid ABC transporter permease [Treponema sp.]